MRTQPATNDSVMTSVIQPPSLNLMATVTARIETDITSPMRLMANFLPRWGAFVFIQWRHIPSWDSVKVMKTLMLYMTMRTWTEPRVKTRMRIEARPMNRMPFWTTSRSDRCMKRLGTQESMAMLPRTRGPSMKPVCAATKRMAPSDTRMIPRSQTPSGKPPIFQVPMSVSRSEAFRVLPATCWTFVSR